MENLNKKYDELQNKYGSNELNSVYGCGEENNPKIALVFMNPTKRNIATNKSWTGLKAQWLGTKQIWDFLTKCGLFDNKINNEIKEKRPKDWSPEFCKTVYGEVKKKSIWITNLAKCTQDDARPLPDDIFLHYKDLLKEELNLVNPQKILFFGNQVSSLMLDETITVSTARQKKFALKIGNKEYESYAVYYPVGNGRFNQPKAIEDIKEILRKGGNMQIDVKKVKIFVTIPANDVEVVRKAICEAGAGIIGNYTHCSTSVKSIGTFKPNDRANPHIGERNKLEFVEEEKLEVICDVENVKKVIAKLREVHPYEEPAIDIVPLIDESCFK